MCSWRKCLYGAVWKRVVILWFLSIWIVNCFLKERIIVLLCVCLFIRLILVGLWCLTPLSTIFWDPIGSMSWVVRLPENSYKPIPNTAWVRARLCKLQKGCIRLAAASDKVYQLLAHGRWFSPGIPASSTTKTGRRHDIAEILLKVALHTINQIKSTIFQLYRCGIRVLGENHRLVASHWQTVSHNVVSSTPRH